uniref:ubiquitin carboxyl-terminal hydrolase 15-like isoform X2 n=1 Tax=Myxine glutinosa TaxID=7769 RepID=UPI00358F3F17
MPEASTSFVTLLFSLPFFCFLHHSFRSELFADESRSTPSTPRDSESPQPSTSPSPLLDDTSPPPSVPITTCSSTLTTQNSSKCLTSLPVPLHPTVSTSIPPPAPSLPPSPSANTSSPNASSLNSRLAAMGRVSSKPGSSIGGCTSSNSCDFSDSCRSTRSHQPGLRGLGNLGNTCFMNSALQCLSNTPPLTKYFLENEYVAELNYDNPLGMRGEIAKAYADLIKQIWQENNSPVTPRAFKMQVGRFAPQFSGFQQQDSQELLSFLLDGLHEDLNRIRNKPYVELHDHGDRADEDVAKEAWTRHCLRNNSIIVDIFHGLFKSTLVCPICQKISVTFDPFCYLSLPLPSKSEQLLEALLIPLDQEVKPTLFKVSIPKPGVVEDLCKALSNISNIPSKNMVVTLIYNHRFDKILSNNDDLSTADRDITVYEVPMDETGTVNAHVAVYLRAKERYGTGLFGRPFIMSLSRDDTTVHTLYTLLLRHMARYVNIPENELYDDREAKRDAKRSSDKCNGEIDMDEGSQEGFKHGGPECNHVPSGKDASKEEQRSPEMRSRRRDHNTRSEDHKPFSIHLVNSLGTMELRRVLDNNRPIDFGNQSYIALEWEKDAKNMFYDDDAAEDVEKHPSVNSMHTRKKYVRLKDCIQLFTSKEQLGADDPWYCPTCKKHQQATKKFDLWSLPKILVVHLKRFSYNKYYRDKLDTLVDFSIRDLDMHEFLAGPQMNSCVYDLIAVSNHYGGLGGGHYTAYAKNQLSQNWYYFDDSSVSSASKDQIVSKAAYVLFYQRRGDDDSARWTAPNVDIMDVG